MIAPTSELLLRLLGVGTFTAGRTKAFFLCGGGGGGGAAFFFFFFLGSVFVASVCSVELDAAFITTDYVLSSFTR